jgi:hypothetical protein
MTFTCQILAVCKRAFAANVLPAALVPRPNGAIKFKGKKSAKDFSGLIKLLCAVMGLSVVFIAALQHCGE